MGSVFFVVGPVRGENLVGLATEQEVEFLLEDAIELFAELLIEIGITQPPNLKPVVGSSHGPPGACMTPSMETWAPTIIFRIDPLYPISLVLESGSGEISVRVLTSRMGFDHCSLHYFRPPALGRHSREQQSLLAADRGRTKPRKRWV